MPSGVTLEYYIKTTPDVKFINDIFHGLREQSFCEMCRSHRDRCIFFKRFLGFVMEDICPTCFYRNCGQLEHKNLINDAALNHWWDAKNDFLHGGKLPKHSMYQHSRDDKHEDVSLHESKSAISVESKQAMRAARSNISKMMSLIKVTRFENPGGRQQFFLSPTTNRRKLQHLHFNYSRQEHSIEQQLKDILEERFCGACGWYNSGDLNRLYCRYTAGILDVYLFQNCPFCWQKKCTDDKCLEIVMIELAKHSLKWKSTVSSRQ